MPSRRWRRRSTAPIPEQRCSRARGPGSLGGRARERSFSLDNRRRRACASERIEMSKVEMADRRADRSVTRVQVETNRGVFMISVAAELANMHPQTLRVYE